MWPFKKKDKRKISGKIIITYDSTTEDFNIESKIYDRSRNSAAVMALLLFHMERGGLNSFIYSSVVEWAGKNEKSIAFAEHLEDSISRLQAITDMAGQIEEVAMKPSQVFNTVQQPTQEEEQ